MHIPEKGFSLEVMCSGVPVFKSGFGELRWGDYSELPSIAAFLSSSMTILQLECP